MREALGDRHRNDRRQQDQEDDHVTSGSCCPMRMLPKIQIGRVFWTPAVKVVTITSSKDSANASSAPETSAVESVGNVTWRNVCQPSAPRSIEASANDV